jgi:hypothetical protein
MGAKVLENLIFIQGSRCFFCNKHLPQQKASIEHLLATSKGGTNTDDNRVACCKTINGILGNKSIKEKFDIVLRQEGSFCCPEDKHAARDLPASTSLIPVTAAPATNDVPAYEKVLDCLRKQPKARPATSKALKRAVNNWLKNYPKANSDHVINQLIKSGIIAVDNDKVTYLSGVSRPADT